MRLAPPFYLQFKAGASENVVDFPSGPFSICNIMSTYNYTTPYTVPLRPLPVETELVGGAGVVALLSLRPLAIGAPVGGKRRRLDLFG